MTYRRHRNISFINEQFCAECDIQITNEPRGTTVETSPDYLWTSSFTFLFYPLVAAPSTEFRHYSRRFKATKNRVSRAIRAPRAGKKNISSRLFPTLPSFRRPRESFQLRLGFPVNILDDSRHPRRILRIPCDTSDFALCLRVHNVRQQNVFATLRFLER